MKRFVEELKDILYDGIDYIMIIVVIAVVAFVINWRLGGLFPKNTTDIVFKEIEEVTQDDKNINFDYGTQTNNEVKEIDDDAEGGKIGGNEIHVPDKEIMNREVEITIPSGCLPAQIGDILVANGLIDSKDQFIRTAIELKMDTRLKSGIFKIEENSTLEDIVNTLTR